MLDQSELEITTQDSDKRNSLRSLAA